METHRGWKIFGEDGVIAWVGVVSVLRGFVLLLVYQESIELFLQ